MYALRVGHLWNGTTLIDDAVVVVEGDRIVKVGAGKRDVPKGAQVVGLRRYTGLPGLIDLHTHITYYWDRKPGTRPRGQRRRPAVTVYYQRQGLSVAYTIVGAPALAAPSIPVTHVGRFALQTLSMGGRTVVTWRRAGHTCVISASDVPARVLWRLADWPTARITD